MSKGSKQRPTQIPPEQLAEKWARTFALTFALHGRIGPRTAGPHPAVFDIWVHGRCSHVECANCGGEWLEGGFYPKTCYPKPEAK